MTHHVRELNVRGTLGVITNSLLYPFITTAHSWEKREEDLPSVSLGRNQKKA